MTIECNAVRRLRAFAALAFISAIVVGAPNATRAADHTLRIVNRGHHTLSGAYSMSTAVRLLFGDKDWGANGLHGNLPPGDQLTITVPSKGVQSKATACTRDMKFVYTDGHVIEPRAFNFCTFSYLQLNY